MVSQRVEQAILEINELPDSTARMEYIHNLPTGIRARVVGEILGRGSAVLRMQREYRELVGAIQRADDAENRRSPFAVPLGYL